jgi:hypothetical protein
MTDREELTIQGLDFTAAPRFAEGHVLTANEANALNQTFFENLRNNFAGRVKKVKEEHGENIESVMDELQGEFDTYAEAYEFGVRKTAAPKDPVTAKALVLAKQAIRTAIQASGAKVKDYTAEAIEEAAANYLKTEAGAELLEVAKARIAEEQAAAKAALASLPMKG